MLTDSTSIQFGIWCSLWIFWIRLDKKLEGNLCLTKETFCSTEGLFLQIMLYGEACWWERILTFCRENSSASLNFFCQNGPWININILTSVYFMVSVVVLFNFLLLRVVFVDIFKSLWDVSSDGIYYFSMLKTIYLISEGFSSSPQ